ncbi:protein YhfH [Alicyclobacillus pomorum]|jgi:YhfH-like protein|uniref:protein YhfH n=1 Tax=Alicyclobacillus pomorum TaxID=204470 RepID=UPI0012EBA6A9|nr:protein YhfH [Alicyclobacillus pomorum]
MIPVAPRRDSTPPDEPRKQCCYCGREFDEQAPSYAVICERCVNIQDEYSQCS